MSKSVKDQTDLVKGKQGNWLPSLSIHGNERHPLMVLLKIKRKRFFNFI